MSFADIAESVVSFFNALPPIAGAFLTFVVGWIVARLARLFAPKLLTLLRFDRFSEKTGITSFLKKGNVRYAPSKLVGILLYWFLMIIVLSETVSRLDEGAASSIALWIRSALPITIAAGIIIVIGLVVVTFLSNFFITIAKNAAIHNPILIGKAIKYIGFIVVATMALEQLGLEADDRQHDLRTPLRRGRLRPGPVIRPRLQGPGEKIHGGFHKEYPGEGAQQARHRPGRLGLDGPAMPRYTALASAMRALASRTMGSMRGTSIQSWVRASGTSVQPATIASAPRAISDRAASTRSLRG